MTSEKLSAACHCGSVVFTVQLSDGFHTARRCNCSFCRMRGAVAVSAPLSGIKVLKGRISLPNIASIRARRCIFLFGMRDIYFSSAPINPDQYGVNVACIENVSPFDFACVEVNDGVTHPSDGGSSGVVGYLRYEPETSPPVETGGKNI